MGQIEVVLLRHAHAERDAASGRDQDRPLSTLGFAQAEAAAAWFAERQLRPQRILCSPAIRTRQTLAALRARLPELEVIEEASIYEATPGELLALIEKHREHAPLLLVGHNPGMETLVALLSDGRSSDARGMPTGAIARLRVDATAIEPGHGEVVEFWWP